MTRNSFKQALLWAPILMLSMNTTLWATLGSFICMVVWIRIDDGDNEGDRR